jgi:hypothetical protein
LTGDVIGTYTNLGCDCWSDWQNQVVSEIREQTSNPVTWAASYGFNRIAVARRFRPVRPVNLPSKNKIRIASEHAVSGHTESGGRYVQGANNPNTKKLKDLFPDGWSDSDIEEAILDAYDHSKRIKTQGDRVKVKGVTKGGMVIEMWVNTADAVIETAYPKGHVK